MRFPAQTFNFLRNLDGLRSFTMTTDRESFHRLRKHLIEAGIHKLIDRIVFTIYTQYQLIQGFTEGTWGTRNRERIVFTNNLTFAKGGKKWISQDVHCQVIAEKREEGGLIGEDFRPVDVPSQSCNHDHHRLGRCWNPEGFPSAMA